MVDLSTSWLGLSLRSPFVVSASPLSRDPNAIAAAVDAGAGAVIMHSLFDVGQLRVLRNLPRELQQVTEWSPIQGL